MYIRNYKIKFNIKLSNYILSIPLSILWLRLSAGKTLAALIAGYVPNAQAKMEVISVTARKKPKSKNTGTLTLAKLVIANESVSASRYASKNPIIAPKNPRIELSIKNKFLISLFVAPIAFRTEISFTLSITFEYMVFSTLIPPTISATELTKLIIIVRRPII